MGCLSLSRRFSGGDGLPYPPFHAIVVVCLIFAVTGCTRDFFRQRADCEVGDVLAEKDVYSQWKIEDSHVYPDPRARFADPTNPDRPPMPPDDPAAFDLSPNPQNPGKSGVGQVQGGGYLDLLAKWDDENRAQDPETKQPEAVVQREEAETVKAGTSHRLFRLRLEQAAELGLVNSRLFQDEREDL